MAPGVAGSGQLAADLLDRAVDQDLSAIAVDPLGEQAPRRADHERGGLIAHVLDGTGLLLRDARERLLGASRQARLELGAVALGLTLGLAARMLADAARVILAGGQLALVLGQQALGFFAQALGAVQLGAHLGGVAVEGAEDRAAQGLPDRGNQDRQGDQQPDLEHQAASASTSRSAVSAVFLVTFSPASCSAAAWATPTDAVRSSSSAACLALAICASAVATCLVSLASSPACRLAVSACR